MARHTPRITAPALLALLIIATPAAAQHAAGHGAEHQMAMPETGARAELIGDIDFLEKRYVALAEALAGKYQWRPAEGVRSVGEVFQHVAQANLMIPGVWGHAARDPEASKFDAHDEAAVRKALEHAFMHARHSIAMAGDDKLDAEVDLFGRKSTTRAAMTLLVAHMHEHLGQQIAYARMNGVVPPWSGGGN